MLHKYKRRVLSMKKRVVSIMLIAAMAAGLAAGCGKSSGSDSGSGG